VNVGVVRYLMRSLFEHTGFTAYQTAHLERELQATPPLTAQPLSA
jgi:hypothetical protein